MLLAPKLPSAGTLPSAPTPTRILLLLCFSDDKRPRIWEALLSFLGGYLFIYLLFLYLVFFFGDSKEERQ